MSGWEPAYLLPGVWFALLATGLGWALRRWWDGVPGQVWAVWGVVLTILFAPVLVGGGVGLPLDMLRGVDPWKRLEASPGPVNHLQWDQICEFAPWQASVRRALGEGEWPLWNRFGEAGMPLLADPQAQVLSPLVAAAYPLPLPAAVGVTQALRVLVPLVFTFVFLRRQRVGEGPALAASLAYGLSGFVMLWLGWPHATSAALLPAILYALAISADRGARRDFLLVGATAFALVTAGHPETMIYPVAVGGVYAVARLVGRGRAEEAAAAEAAAEEAAAEEAWVPARAGSARPAFGLRRRGRLLAGWAAAGGIAAALAAPALLPAAGYLPQSMRAEQARERARYLDWYDPFAGWQTPEGRREKLAETARLLVPQIAPNAYGNNRFGPYWGLQNINEDAAGFAGTATLLAALLSLVPLGGRARRLPRERMMMAVGVVALVLVAKVPGVLEAVMKSPLGDFSSAWQHRIQMLLAFAIVYLAAGTWERWRRGELPRWAAAAAAVPLGAAIVWGYLAMPGSPGPPEPGTLDRLRHASLAVQLGALATAAALLTWRFPGGRGRPTAAAARAATPVALAAMAAMAVIVAGELLFFHLPVNPPAPRRLFYPPTPALEFLQRHAAGWRITAPGLTLLPNSAAVLGLADLRASSPVRPWLVRRELMLINAEPTSAVEWIQRTDRPLLDLFAVRYALTPRRESPGPEWRRVFQSPDGWVWVRPTALPPLFLPRSAERFGDDWVAEVAAITDFADAARFVPGPGPGPVEPEEAVAHPPPGWRAAVPDGSALSDLAVGSHRVRARALLTEPRLLASSIFQDGGWRLVAGGERRPTLRANGPLVGAWLPAGAHAVELLYRPAGFVWGCLLAALGLAAAAAWWAAPVGRPGPG